MYTGTNTVANLLEESLLQDCSAKGKIFKIGEMGKF